MWRVENTRQGEVRSSLGRRESRLLERSFPEPNFQDFLSAQGRSSIAMRESDHFW
jgi:hypothetical protein